VRVKKQRRVGLARVLSKLGYCSRSQAAELIRAGRISVNGKIQRDPEVPLSDARAQITVDGKAISSPAKVYVMLNKPRGIVTTAADEKDRETVYGILKKDSNATKSSSQQVEGWLAPVGRLDKASEGLLLLTNDSEWGARVSAPETHLDKTYHVQIETVADEALMETLVKGIKSEDGTMLRVKQCKLLRSGEKNCWLEIVLDEGKNRHIRRIMASLGVEVLRLVRVAIGPLQLGELAKGEHRSLLNGEKHMLDRAMHGKRR
jgi:23S rRNA pseudouridine2605 synthase